MTNKLKEVEKTDLYFYDGNSDKVYIAILFKDERDTYRVLFKFGRRNHVYNWNEKYLHKEMSYGEAMGVYLKQINSKLKKGYVRK